jgi:uncharacterized membrane protein/nitrite reductase/ring-hydroxylating ferredoxin subunit
MRSKASFKGHPIHPILVTFPIALYITTFICDIAYFLNGNELYHSIAQLLSKAAVGSALLAAVPGLVDFLFTVPPQSSGKKRAAKHGLLNVTVLILFVLAIWRRNDDGSNYLLVLALEGIGVVLLSIAGWLGGTLVYRNQIGVDLRYAESGKWKEVYIQGKGGLIEVGTTDELKVNQMKLVHVGAQRIVIARTENGYKAFDDRCTHRGGSLAAGAMICGTVQCPWHGSQFSANDGKVTAGPATEKIATYTLSESSGKLLLKL